MYTVRMMSLPKPTPDMLEISEALKQQIQQRITQQGEISFADYMQSALYTPGLGYYSAGSAKIGREGDFTTAPEISPLFSYSLANQISEILMALPSSNILEFGAGTGCMAAHILQQLAQLNALPTHYYILDVSADLRERQYHTIAEHCPQLLSRVRWLSALPADFHGIILANEVLDAMPVNLFCWQDNQFYERFVTLNSQNEFCFMNSVIQRPSLYQHLNPYLADLPQPYTSEINRHIKGWLTSIAQNLSQGIVLLIDYGFPGREYYHPERQMGTLMCHYQHHAHSDPFLWPGLQDITAHVDFTAVADAGIAAGLELIGYTHQASFLMANDILKLSSSNDIAAHYQLAQGVKRLLLPNEMGELFKVMALGKNWHIPLKGFTLSDMSHHL